MLRRLTLGGIAFAIVVAGLKRFDVVLDDLDRYNRLRAMSDEPPLLQTLLEQLPFAEYVAAGRGEAASLLKSVRDDLRRYSRIANM
ncbi:MAG: hypothetical protein ACLPYS_20055 [Vulcanimicrobiaceae bacterium]